jgi:PAT family beta-lactamase induction signal transducer AmpG
MLLPAKFLGGFSGDIVDATDYVFFFGYAALLGLPAILLILFLMRVLNADRLRAAERASLGSG